MCIPQPPIFLFGHSFFLLLFFSGTGDWDRDILVWFGTDVPTPPTPFPQVYIVYGMCGGILWMGHLFCVAVVVVICC